MEKVCGVWCVARRARKASKAKAYLLDDLLQNVDGQVEQAQRRFGAVLALVPGDGAGGRGTGRHVDMEVVVVGREGVGVGERGLWGAGGAGGVGHGGCG